MGKLIKINTNTKKTDDQRKEPESYTAGKGTLVKIGSPSVTTTQTGTQSAPRSTGTSGNKSSFFNTTKKTTAPSFGKVADSGYTEQKSDNQRQANRQTVKDWWKREQQKAAEDDSAERARTAKFTGGANIDNSKEFLANAKKTFSGFRDDADTQRKRALQSKMGVGENWSNPKTAVGNAVESAAAGTVASYLNALGTILRDDGKRQGLAVDRGDIEATETDTWHNRWGEYLQGEADRVQKISDDAYTRGSEGLNNAQKLLFDVGVAGAQMLGDKAFGAAAPIAMAARGFGSGSMQARQEGGSHTQQLLYGAASAAVEALTEKMFDGVAHIYGKGAADDVVQKVAEKLAKSPQGQSVVRALMNAGGEGLEEMISAIVDPALQTIYNDKVINGSRYGEKGAYDGVKIADILYDGAVGMALGLVGGSVDVAQTMRGTGVDSAAESTQTTEKTGTNSNRDDLQTSTNEKTGENFNREGLQATENKKSSPQIEESGTAEAQRAAQSAVQAQREQETADVPRLLTPEEHVAKPDEEAVERILEAFAVDDGYVSQQRQNQMIYHHGEDLFYRAVGEGFKRGLITNDGSGNIYSLKPETRKPGYYGSKGKNAKYLDNLAKAANMTILRGDLESGEMGFYINGRAVLAEDAGVEIARHEVAHHLKQAAPEEFNAFLDYVKGAYGESVDAALEKIRNNYAERGETLSDAVAEEELAAYYAGQLMTDETAMKRLAGENLSLAERILDWLKQSLAKLRRAFGGEDVETKQLREAAELFENAIRAAKSGTVETDGVVRHAIETLPDGKQYVRADRQVIFGNDPESWKEQLRNYINGKIRQGQNVTLIGADGDALLLTNDSAGKLSDNHTSDGRTMSDDAYERKANAAAHIDELAQVSREEQGTKKDRDGRHGGMASGGWNYRTAYFRDFDGKYYEITISTAKNADGKMIYNIGQMHERSIPQINGSSAANSGALRGNASASSISQSAGNSNTQNSGKRSAYEDTAEQLKEIQRLQRQNARLREQLIQANKNVRAAGRGTDRESVRAQVRELKKRYGSRADINAVTNAMVKLFDAIADNTISEREMRNRADKIARMILNESFVQMNPKYEEYADLRSMLHNQRVSIGDHNQLEIGNEHKAFREEMRNRTMGRLIIAEDGMPVDELYESLSESYPELFPDDVYDQRAQITQIADVLDDVAAVMDNPFTAVPQAREFLAGDILERFFGTPQTYKAELQRDRAAAEQRFKKQKEEHAKQMQALNERHQREFENWRARQTDQERREQIAKGTERLAKKLLRPTDKRHIPAELRETVRAFVTMIDTESGFDLQLQSDGTYKRVKAGYGEATGRTLRARELQAMLAKLEKESGSEIDPELRDKLDEIAEIGETKIAKMSRGQLNTVYEAMRSIEKMVTNYDKMLGDSKYATVSKAANAMLEENQGRKAKTQWKKPVQMADDLAELGMMTPETFFHKLGKAGDELFRQMRRSADQQTRILKEGVDHAKKALERSGLNVKQLEQETHKFELESGETLTMTTAQIMNLHALWKREQARDHIGLGGIKPTKIESGKGLKATAAVAAEKVTLNDLGNILKVLTPEQKAFVDELQKFMAGRLAFFGNEASRAVYGYDKFTESDYWPIRVNKDETQNDPGKEAQAKTIVGFGMAKAAKPKASNGLEVGSFMDVYSQHLSEMATYASWLATSENLTRINNFKFTDAEGKPTGQTVKTLLTKIYGNGGNEYWKNLMGDIAQGTKAGRDGGFFDWLTANTKAAAVGANIRVILQQPTSILRATSMIHPKYFVDKPHKGGWEKALKYSGIAQWKDWGYFEMDTGRSVRGLITGPESKVEWLREKSMAAAGWADSKTWGALWNAVERETAEKHPELSGEALYEAAAERFGEVVDRTQVVDSVLHRSQIMRSGGVNKMATSFMSEPMKTYNMVLRDFYDINAAADGPAKVRAKRKFVGTATALTVSFALNALAQSLVDAARDDDKEQKYWEKFAEAYRGNFGGNFNPLNYVPYAKDIVSIIQGFDVTRMDMDAVTNTVRAFRQFWKTVQDEHNRIKPQEDYEDKGQKTMFNAGFDLACELLAAAGLPLANVKRDLLAAVNTAFSAAGSYRMQYELDKLLYDIDYSANRKRWWKILYAASQDNWDDYMAIYNDMLNQGLTDKQIKNGMEGMMTDAQGVDKVTELKYRWTPPNERSEFNYLSKQVSEIEGPRKALDLGWW